MTCFSEYLMKEKRLSRALHVGSSVWLIKSTVGDAGCSSMLQVPFSGDFSSLLPTTTTVFVTATVLGWSTSGRPLVARLGWVHDRQTLVECRLTADGALLHWQCQTRVIGKAEAARHALTGQTIGEIT